MKMWTGNFFGQVQCMYPETNRYVLQGVRGQNDYFNLTEINMQVGFDLTVVLES